MKIAVTPKKAWGMLHYFRDIQAGPVKEIAAQAERPFQIALIGSAENTKRLAERLSRETNAVGEGAKDPVDISDYVSFHPTVSDVAPNAIPLDADDIGADEVLLAPALAHIVATCPDVRIALGRHVPAFRAAVAAKIIADDSWTNAKIATLSALPGVIPFTDVLLPVTSVGDMMVLTRNQGLMLLRIAAAYGLPIDLGARLKELLPIVGSAFGWRAIARELVGLVPGGVGVLLKGSIAYAGTYTVGKAAQIFYATGHTLSAARLKQLGSDAARDGRVRVKAWLVRRGRRGVDSIPAETVDKSVPIEV